MDYEDDDYDQYQQYEDEIYKDSSDRSEEGSDAGDSEFEDTMLSHIHYSTNVYKKIETSAKPAEEPEQNGTAVSSTQKAADGSQTDHLAEPLSAVDDYFKAANKGTELDSENEEGYTKAKPSTLNAPIIVIDDDEDSKYSVEKKKDVDAWDTKSASKALDVQDDSGSDSDSEGPSASDDESLSDAERVRHGREGGEVENDDAQGLDEHYLDVGRKDAEDERSEFDLEAELGHLDDQKFLGRGRYYLESKASASQRACFNCGQPGHLSRDCIVMVCHICGAVGEHSYRECPAMKCLNCLKTGHTADACPMPRGHGRRNVCSKCLRNDHPTEDCPSVWRQYVTTSSKPLQSIVPYCYNCAASLHFGDDCNRQRPNYARAGSAFRGHQIFEMPTSSGRYHRHHDWDRDVEHYGDVGGSSSSRYRHRDDDSSSSRHHSSKRRERSRDGHSRSTHEDDRHRHESRSSGGKRDKKDHHESRDSRDNRKSRKHRDSKDGREDRDHRESRDSGHSRGSRSEGHHHSGSSRTMDPMAPTMANGGNMNDPIVIGSPMDNTRDSNSSHGHSRPHHALPSRPTSSSSSYRRPRREHGPQPSHPNNGYSNGAAQAAGNGNINDRISFADQNAFPRGGGGGGSGHSQPALIGVSSTTGGQAARLPPTPMYTGGYSRRR
ncbi:hypothetical protein KVV02_004132 [Mortierella alpina]|uniref:CCHC-type domain-containing protein n=1 Tax=Mortierella alpina TaxID=64518 RepID=A0A9P8CZA1_MORAP|nr:hypothetical protein KVV02_004132 [Mortierella alpina]